MAVSAAVRSVQLLLISRWRGCRLDSPRPHHTVELDVSLGPNSAQYQAWPVAIPHSKPSENEQAPSSPGNEAAPIPALTCETGPPLVLLNWQRKVGADSSAAQTGNANRVGFGIIADATRGWDWAQVEKERVRIRLRLRPEIEKRMKRGASGIPRASERDKE